jgi:NADH-quinone oxidoreductase subunit K
MIPVEHYLALSFALFVMGAAGALIRRNPVIILMSIALMLTAVNVNLIAFSRVWGTVHGQLFSLFIMADAAAQTALGLGILLACRRRQRPPASAEANLLKTAADEQPVESFTAGVEPSEPAVKVQS